MLPNPLRDISEAPIFEGWIDKAIAGLPAITMEVIRLQDAIPMFGIAVGFDDDLVEIVVVHCVPSSSKDLTDNTDGKIVFGQINDDLDCSDLNVIEDEHLSERDVFHSGSPVEEGLLKEGFP
jgi:hypothetical protein